MKISKFLCFLFFILSIQSCKKSTVDTQLPFMVVLSPESGNVYTSSSKINVVATLHDYVELARYKIEIRWNEDAQNISPNPNIAPWFYFTEEQISGKNTSLSKAIDVPEDIRFGNYDLILSCFDKAGNEKSQIYVINIKD